MVGPGMWGRMAGRRGLPDMCDPSAAGFSEWRIDQIERAVRPTDAQKASFDELRIASTKAAELMAGVCPKEFPRTSADGLTFMEKRLESMLQAVKIFRPAFDVFYASLSDDQKSRLDGAGPGGSGWPWWQRYHG
jgi:LTXXQ motif family protein